MPPPPPDLIGIPADDSFRDLDFDHISPCSVPMTEQANADIEDEFLLGMGVPPHPELDQAIADGDDIRVLAALAKARTRYPQPSVTFNTAIQTAIRCDQLGVLDLLLQRGIPADDRNLQAAIARANPRAVARLLEELPEGKNRILDYGHTALTLAVHDEDLVIWLLSKGADPNVQDAWAETPLSRAVGLGSYGVIDRLLDAGADIKQGAPLHMSLRIQDEAECIRLMERLLSLGAPVDKYQGENSIMWERVAFQRGTALHLACRKGNTGAIRLLLAHGADPTRKQKLLSVEVAGSSAWEELKARPWDESQARDALRLGANL
ncbi:hypothetical protein LTR12_007220 [Friedmanniomyces endolithicus]|nr:hypothetical protein LTR12_007220 [Friedmanniomyces endolithicus]